MDIKLLLQGVVKYILGVLIVGALLFIPAGSFSYYNAWILMGLLFIPMFIVGIILWFINPKLLESRLNAKEKERDQKEVIASSAIMFIFGFVFAGLNYRFKWFVLSNKFTLVASIVFIISYILYGEVLRENAFLLRTIEVKGNQKVVDTGMYALVRHPMYLITIVLFLSMPIILGSIHAFIIFLSYPFIIVKRIINEEKVLRKDLKGYKEYMKKVKYRLIPLIW